MKDKLQSAFDNVRADDALLSNTAAYLAKERSRREQKRSRIRPARLIGAFAAMLLLTVGILHIRGLRPQEEAVAYVSIDVNPSVELVLNRQDSVIATSAYNMDGEAILQQVDVRGKPYEEAVAVLLAEMRRQGYLLEDALVTVTVQTEDKTKEQILCNALLQVVGSQVDVEQSPAELEVFPVTQAVREIAHGCHMSAAKYLAIQELMEVDQTATLEDYSDATIRQIRQRTEECRGEHGNGGGYSGGGNQGGEPAQGGHRNEGKDHQNAGNATPDENNGSGNKGSAHQNENDDTRHAGSGTGSAGNGAGSAGNAHENAHEEKNQWKSQGSGHGDYSNSTQHKKH